MVHPLGNAIQPAINLEKMIVNPFSEHPEFRTIWPNRQKDIEECCIEFLREPVKEDNFIIQIVKPMPFNLTEITPIGITGYFELDDKIILAWHGILPSVRKQGYSFKALELLAGIVLERYPNATDLIELVPADREEEVGAYFKNIGFVKTGNIIEHECLLQGVVWLEYKINLKELAEQWEK